MAMMSGAKSAAGAPGTEAGTAAKGAKAAVSGKAAKARSLPALKIILAATAMLVVLGAGGFLAWPYVFPPPPPPPPPAPVKPVAAAMPPVPAPTTVVAPGPAPATATNPSPAAAATPTTTTTTGALQAVQNLAGKNFQAVANAGSALTREQSQVDNILDGKDPDVHTPAPPATVEAAPPVPAAVSASVAFRAWVDGVKINAVNVSPTLTIAIINGHPAKPGDMIDASQGIVFDHVDVNNQAIIFRDRTGALAPAKY
jgi:hypothetical protein